MTERISRLSPGAIAPAPSEITSDEASRVQREDQDLHPGATQEHGQARTDEEQVQERQGLAMADLPSASEGAPSLQERTGTGQVEPEQVQEHQTMNFDQSLNGALEELGIDPQDLSADDKVLLKETVLAEYEDRAGQLSLSDFMQGHSRTLDVLKELKLTEGSSFLTSSDLVKLGSMLKDTDLNCAETAVKAYASAKQELGDEEVTFSHLWQATFNDAVPEELQNKSDREISLAYAQKAQDELTADTQETGITFVLPELGDSAKAILTAINSALDNSNEKLALSVSDIYDNLSAAAKSNTITSQEAMILTRLSGYENSIKPASSKGLKLFKNLC